MSAAAGTEPKPPASTAGAELGRAPRRALSVNLARRPFANTRHIRRLGLALWLVGALLLAVDGWLYWQSLFGIESKKEERAAIDAAIAEERERLARAEQALAAVDLARQNVEATFLNDRIASRTFPWSALFDQLADVLPKRVRLLSLAPRDEERRDVRSNRVAPASTTAARDDGRVRLHLTGIAESDEALLELLDNLFAHPAFDSPQLPNEVRRPEGVSFSLNVLYLPGIAAAAAAAPTPTVTELDPAALPSPTPGVAP